MGGEAEYGLGVEEDEEVPQELLQEDPATPRGTGRDSTDEGQLARSSVLARPPTFLSRDEGHHALSGMRMYVRLVLGRQKQTSWIKKEHANGAANWHQVSGGARGRVCRAMACRRPETAAVSGAAS